MKSLQRKISDSMKRRWNLKKNCNERFRCNTKKTTGYFVAIDSINILCNKGFHFHGLLTSPCDPVRITFTFPTFGLLLNLQRSHKKLIVEERLSQRSCSFPNRSLFICLLNLNQDSNYKTTLVHSDKSLSNYNEIV